MGLLTLTMIIPLAGAVLVLLLPDNSKKAIHGVSLGATALSFLVSVYLFVVFDRSSSGMQFVERANWIPAFDIHYFFGVDGLSMPLVILTTLLSFVSVIASLGIDKRIKEYFFWFQLLEAGMLGVFMSLDFFLFYVFWEVMLVPMYFLIGVWGGPKKEYASIKFFLYTLFGSVFMLLAMLALYFSSSPRTFDLLELAKQHPAWSREFQIWVFLALYVGFAIKVPVFPFHTWLPLAHVEAPTAVSVLLAGVLLKMGVYGFLRVSFPILPAATTWFMPFLAALALVNIVYGAFCAMAQTDMKKMVAYSSVNHMGYCLLGLAAASATGFNGAVFQMITHGVITGSLFLLVGVIYDRAHTRDINVFGGLGAKLPVFTGLMTVGCMASLGLPGLAGFVSEFLCFLGGFGSWRIVTAFAVLGILITAAFFLRMIQKVFLGPLNSQWAHLEEISARELYAIVPLTILTIVLGIWPRLALDMMNPTVTQIAAIFK
ncbi:MAG: NADH-quinone oxidoreductase subunit M [Elusimicrobia bacterium]|nr:NADH-quinone oxidoreductase subunit M [Elusimicrobiota bacterium]